MKLFRFSSVALVVLSAGFTLRAQQDSTPHPASPEVTSIPVDTTQPSNPALTVRDEKVLKDFEPAANTEYTLGAGDQISLDFPGHPELNDKMAIGPDGLITVKYAGAVRITDLTREQAAKAIVDALSKYYSDASVTVSIDKYSANKVRVIGYVQHPGEIFFDDTPTLLDAIGKAGLISPTTTSPTGGASNVGPGVPETCTIYRGNDTAVQVELRKLLMSGSTLADLRLRRNDIVYVPQPNQKFVSVLGEVGKVSNVPLTPDSTLISVLAEAGCCTETAGFNPKIHVLQRSTGKQYTFEYKKLMTLNGGQEITLHSGDLIYIQKSTMYKLTYIFEKLSPIATMATVGVLAASY
ncbi:polysaccharide biosynthesis/export family protein [Acidicapsa dinghuensis]|uniref:Polysaccharide biosynthesis/export family protein n=1 Tax=Acidicapsa dinghuensis TaxID=2218256 RepID=A0ABW1ED30_9BACT|nr:polysaccharide biosynthesis/export family protein [Acidicapsa dinghuensis]